MAIDGVQPVFREIPAASAVPQLSLTRRDRELQMEEGQPPMEVASTELQTLRWQKSEDLREKWKKRQQQRNAGASSQATQEATLNETPEDLEEAQVAQPEAMQSGTELPGEEDTGTLFDDRS
jgi:hypothetical protein